MHVMHDYVTNSNQTDGEVVQPGEEQLDTKCKSSCKNKNDTPYQNIYVI